MTADDQLTWNRIQLEDALARRHWSDAVNISLSLWAQPLAEHTYATPDGVRRVRLDRWVQGLWESYLPAPADVMRETIINEVGALMGSAIVASQLDRQQLAEQMGQLPWGQQLRVEQKPVLRDEVEYARHELRLIEQAARSQGDLRTSTQLRLVELYEHRQEATQWYQIYLRARGRQPESSTATAPFRELLQRWEGQAVAPVEEPFPGWGDEPAILTLKERSSSDIRFAGILVDAERGSLPERLNISIDWPGGQGLQFSNADVGRPWKAYSPNTGRFLRSDMSLSRAWGLGQQCIVQIGTELFGVSPMTTQGERRATVYWPRPGATPVDTLGDRSQIMMAFYPEQKPAYRGFPVPGEILIDDYEHIVGAVGPVRPGYFCIQQKGMLVANDSATGQELWRRVELPELAECVGDDEHVLIWGRDDRFAKLLRVTDGAFVRSVELPGRMQDRRLSHGPFALFGSGLNDRRTAPYEVDVAPAGDGGDAVPVDGADPEAPDAPAPSDPEAPDENAPVTLTWWNMLEHNVIWSRTWPAGSIPFSVDRESFGLLTPGGDLIILESATGEVRATHRIALPAVVRSVSCSIGERTLLIAVSGEIDDVALLAANQSHRGHRREYVNGTLHCLDRQSGRLLWESELQNTVLPLDQPSDLPVFVLTTSRQDQKNSNLFRSTLEIYDRRNGKLLYRDDADGPKWNYYAISGDRKSKRVTIKTQHTLFELDFTGAEATGTAP